MLDLIDKDIARSIAALPTATMGRLSREAASFAAEATGLESSPQWRLLLEKLDSGKPVEQSSIEHARRAADELDDVYLTLKDDCEEGETVNESDWQDAFKRARAAAAIVACVCGSAVEAIYEATFSVDEQVSALREICQRSGVQL